MDPAAHHVAEKLNLYSLKCGEARNKFQAAFAHQKKYIKAVGRMRYGFETRLSAVDKQLLEQERL